MENTQAIDTGRGMNAYWHVICTRWKCLKQVMGNKTTKLINAAREQLDRNYQSQSGTTVSVLSSKFNLPSRSSVCHHQLSSYTIFLWFRSLSKMETRHRTADVIMPRVQVSQVDFALPAGQTGHRNMDTS